MRQHPLIGKHLVILVVFLSISTIYFPIITSEEQSNLYINSQPDSCSNNFSDNRYFYNAYNTPIRIRDFAPNKINHNKLNTNQKEITYTLDLPSHRDFFCGENSNVIYVPDDYPSIQSAIDNATAWDTIIVRDGTYTERIVVDKPLTIQSENGYTNCVILQKDGSYVINIINDFVTISGFKIIGLDANDKKGILINNVNNTTISWNKFSKSYFFIRGTLTNNNTIHDNIMGSSGSYIESWAIWLKNGNNNLIYNNTITGLDMYAVPVHLENSNNNLVRNNILRGSYDMGLLSSKNNTIMNNTMGPGFWAQIYMENSTYNTFQNNTFSSAAYDGVQIYSSNHTTFCNNTLAKSGIFVYESYDNIIKNNTINDKPLIYLENISDYAIVEEVGQIVLVNCDNILIHNQTIINSIQGIELFKTSNTTISECNIRLQEFESVYAAYSNDNLIYNCSFSDCYNALGIYDCNRTEINSNYIHSFMYTTPCMIVSDSHYNNIIWNNITDNFLGIELHGSNYNNISHNEIYKVSSGSANGVIRLRGSKFNNITFNNIHHQHRGIDLYDSSDNNLVMRNIVDCGSRFTVVVDGSNNNLIYHSSVH